ncbi:ATP-binding cassette domain-containing protein [Brevibacillus thermoruber]|uniref:ATP-binding cassette domain-containing protein n=1 Tax=Brevibacillus thermoruber TaxID=33942 RepID=A0A9X3TUF7_9BACL|nr:ATP-binding cassette domain-containing protein [Brevibacillus thermoruber]MDA5110712.1 ATP-binding cassette domain-containing protein [Brevibacillus thermoruber]
METKCYSFPIRMLGNVQQSIRSRRVREIFSLTEEKLDQVPIIQNVNVLIDGVIYITGYSGSGKSTLLRLIKHDYTDAFIPEPPENQNVPIIDLLGTDLEEAIQILGWVGLGEAYLYLTPYSLLSEGQKARFQLAYALAQQPSLLLIDEFLSNLDRVTAKVVAYSFQKICRKLGITTIVATAHEDLLEPLAPDTFIKLDLHGECVVVRHPVSNPYIPELNNLQIQIGTIDDYNALKRFHYFNDAEFEDFETEIYSIRLHNQTIGVCVLASPYPIEWNEVDYFREINERVKSIVRLIIHPAFRGAGLAKLLIRPSISNIQYIETCSALGLYMPIYLAGGYERVELPTNQRTMCREKLEKRLIELGLTDLTALHEERVCEQFILTLKPEQVNELSSLALNLYVENLLNLNLYFRKIASLRELLPNEKEELADMIREASIEIPLNILLQETVYFPMQGFAVKHRDENSVTFKDVQLTP